MLQTAYLENKGLANSDKYPMKIVKIIGLRLRNNSFKTKPSGV